MSLREIFLAIVHDRVIQAGTGTSAVSGLGAAGLKLHPLQSGAEMLANLQPYVAFFAALFGGLSAVATFFYLCLKIRRMLADPRAKE